MPETEKGDSFTVKQEKYRSFKEWSSRGYKIKCGEKAVWIDNQPMFSRSQVLVAVRPATYYRKILKRYIDNDNHPFGDSYDPGGPCCGMGCDFGDGLHIW